MKNYRVCVEKGKEFVLIGVADNQWATKRDVDQLHEVFNKHIPPATVEQCDIDLDELLDDSRYDVSNKYIPDTRGFLFRRGYTVMVMHDYREHCHVAEVTEIEQWKTGNVLVTTQREDGHTDEFEGMWHGNNLEWEGHDIFTLPCHGNDEQYDMPIHKDSVDGGYERPSCCQDDDDGC